MAIDVLAAINDRKHMLKGSVFTIHGVLLSTKGVIKVIQTHCYLPKKAESVRSNDIYR